MVAGQDTRAWLRANGHEKIADEIDELMQRWRDRGVTTRRNWWDVLAGSEAGEPRTIDGKTFPVLAAARDRKGWQAVDNAVQTAGDVAAPSVATNTRWQKEHKTRSAAPSHGGSAATKRGARAGKRKYAATKPPSELRIASPKRKAANRTAARRPKASEPELVVKNFAHLEDVRVPLRDLVVLVGPQATGKSLVLELLKLVIDRSRITRTLKQHGFAWREPSEFASLYFGGGFDRSWTPHTEVHYGNQHFTLKDVAGARAYKGEDAVFYIPAHRTLAIAEGWPRSFAQYQVETPYVARRFSEELLTSLNQGLVGKAKIFPHDRRLKDAFRTLIDEAVFHGATLRLDSTGMRKQFVLDYQAGSATLPFMAWTAGQREFTPLLLGLYHLLPAGGGPKKKEIQWAVLEEPEMGLHPKAIVAVMAVVLDLLARGYKVALSTHSPTVLELVWGMSRLKGVSDGAARLCRMMGLPERDKNVLHTARRALSKSYAVVHVQHEDSGRVRSRDISALDPGAADPREWGWGGLTGFSARVADAIAGARSARPR